MKEKIKTGTQHYSNRQIFVLTMLRVSIGWHFLYEGLVKVYTPGWTAKGYLLGSVGPLSPIFKGLAHSGSMMGFVDFLNEWGLVLIGFSLFIGLLSQPSKLFGIALLLLYYLAYPPFAGLGVNPHAEGSYWIVNKNLIEMAALSVLYLFPSSHITGIDRFLKMKKIVMYRYLTITILIFSGSITHKLSFGQAHYDVTEEIGKSNFQWPKGKKAAISLSFDDARASQVDNGIRIFDKHSIKATFYANPGNLTARAEKWRAAAANGHEIANHSTTHPCSGNFAFSRDNSLEGYTLEKIARDIDKASDSIEHLVGIRPVTFAYPCGQSFVGRGKATQSYVPLIASRFIAGRGWLDEAPNDPRYCDLSKVLGISSDGSGFAHIKELIDQAKAMRGWLVLCGHEILPESENKKQSTYTSMLEELCSYASSPENGIWVAPVKDVASYIQKKRGETKKEYQIYLDPAQPIEKRVKDLLSKMTLEEKVGQMNMPCLYVKELGETIADKTSASKKFVAGTLEQGLGPGGGFYTLANNILQGGPRQQALFFNELQKIAIENTRLGIPLLQTEEGTHGLMASGATIFPEGPGLGSTWNMPLIRDIYAAAAKEARSVGIHQLYTLAIEPIRDPRLGRNEECYSEDPYLSARIAEHIVEGAQGDDVSALDKVVAGLCHFPGQSEPVSGLEKGEMEISERKLREVFLPPWEAGIKKSGALGVMATYPAIDGEPVHASEWILTKILRNELGFEGLVMSEGNGFETLIWDGIVATQKEAGAMALKAGVDVGITYEAAYMGPLIESVKEGLVPEELIDRAVSRILRIKFLQKLFESPYVDPDRAEMIVHNNEHQELALKAAHEGIVLLKNENNLLPLRKDIGSVAVIGPNADNGRNQLGDYTSKAILQDIVTVLDGIKGKVPEKTKVEYVKGCDVLLTDNNNIEKASKVAGKADVAIVVVGENERRAANNTGTNGENKDVANLNLTGLQQSLVEAVYATGTPTIVVLINGRPLSTRWIADHVPAIVEAWIPGEKGGNAIADILFGDVNPSGKLSVTVPRHSGQLPVYYNHKPSKANRTKETQPYYVDMTMEPLYEFGFGLSYTSFEYENLTITPSETGPGGNAKVKLKVTNTGKRQGAEVVQLYINDVLSSITTPVIELKGFEKVLLGPGEKADVEFTLTPYDLSLLNRNMERVVEPGVFKIMVGSSSKDIRLTGELVIK